MNSRLRIAGLAVMFIIGGFALGRLTSPTQSAAVTTAAQLAKRDHTPDNAQLAAPSEATIKADYPGEPNPVGKDPVENRLEVLEWLKQKKIFSSIRIVGNDGDVTRNLIDVFELNASQIRQLNDSLKRVKADLAALAEKSATSHLSPDGGTLTVSVPGATPQQSGPLYDRLLASFQNTLGVEKFASFNSLAGDGFERIFDHFGLNAVRFEVSLESKTIVNGAPLLKFKRFYVDADGRGNGSVSGALTADMLVKTHPVLARHLLPASGKP